MKKSTPLLSQLFLIVFIACSSKESEINFEGAYLNQTPPGMTCEIFAPGILSTDANEFNATFTLDGKQIYFTVNTDTSQFIMMMEYKNGTWGERRLAPFSGRFRDVDPFVSPDGMRIYFSSNRAIDGNGKKNDCDFWYVEQLQSGGWSEPIHIANPATPNKHDFYFTMANNGTIYYSVFNDDGTGDIYRIHDNETQLLQFGISTEYNEHDPFIAPDESYLIFSSNRPGGLGSNDLYISFRDENDSWSTPQNMGSSVNSAKYDYCPILSPDGKYLFFSSSRSGNGDVFWIDAKIVSELKK